MAINAYVKEAEPIEVGTTQAVYFRGDPGPEGPVGPQGPACTIEIGTTVAGDYGDPPSVTNSGTPENAVLDFVLPKGDKGDTGNDGADGAAATITIGTVTTGEAGTNVSVTNSGTSAAAVFNFTIPKGDKGDTGDTGPAGTTNYNNLTNKPTIPTKVSDLYNDSGFITLSDLPVWDGGVE